ncbi:uncharacterized protein LOC143236395 [Tachypleus tridentatus]|uniref:uncharacterized protein LOC143236395 n=1 Tax=Tachypleus tridentatus TaxID=6853 RepID=UPI003FD12AC7
MWSQTKELPAFISHEAAESPEGDSIDCLQALELLHVTSHPVLLDIFNYLAQFSLSSVRIRFHWIPGYIGITSSPTPQLSMSALVTLRISGNATHLEAIKEEEIRDDHPMTEKTYGYKIKIYTKPSSDELQFERHRLTSYDFTLTHSYIWLLLLPENNPNVTKQYLLVENKESHGPGVQDGLDAKELAVAADSTRPQTVKPTHLKRVAVVKPHTYRDDDLTNLNTFQHSGASRKNHGGHRHDVRGHNNTGLAEEGYRVRAEIEYYEREHTVDAEEDKNTKVHDRNRGLSEYQNHDELDSYGRRFHHSDHGGLKHVSNVGKRRLPTEIYSGVVGNANKTKTYWEGSHGHQTGQKAQGEAKVHDRRGHQQSERDKSFFDRNQTKSKENLKERGYKIITEREFYRKSTHHDKGIGRHGSVVKNSEQDDDHYKKEEEQQDKGFTTVNNDHDTYDSVYDGHAEHLEGHNRDYSSQVVPYNLRTPTIHPDHLAHSSSENKVPAAENLPGKVVPIMNNKDHAHSSTNKIYSSTGDSHGPSVTDSVELRFGQRIPAITSTSPKIHILTEEQIKLLKKKNHSTSSYPVLTPRPNRYGSLINITSAQKISSTETHFPISHHWLVEHSVDNVHSKEPYMTIFGLKIPANPIHNAAQELFLSTSKPESSASPNHDDTYSLSPLEFSYDDNYPMSVTKLNLDNKRQEFPIIPKYGERYCNSSNQSEEDGHSETPGISNEKKHLQHALNDDYPVKYPGLSINIDRDKPNPNFPTNTHLGDRYLSPSTRPDHDVNNLNILKKPDFNDKYSNFPVTTDYNKEYPNFSISPDYNDEHSDFSVIPNYNKKHPNPSIRPGYNDGYPNSSIRPEYNDNILNFQTTLDYNDDYSEPPIRPYHDKNHPVSSVKPGYNGKYSNFPITPKYNKKYSELPIRTEHKEYYPNLLIRPHFDNKHLDSPIRPDDNKNYSNPPVRPHNNFKYSNPLIRPEYGSKYSEPPTRLEHDKRHLKLLIKPDLDTEKLSLSIRPDDNVKYPNPSLKLNHGNRNHELNNKEPVHVLAFNEAREGFNLNQSIKEPQTSTRLAYEPPLWLYYRNHIQYNFADKDSWYSDTRRKQNFFPSDSSIYDEVVASLHSNTGSQNHGGMLNF